MKKLIILSIIISSAFFIPNRVIASHFITPTPALITNTNNILNRFKYYHEFKRIDGTTPQIVEVALPIGEFADKSKYALVEGQTTVLQPYEIVIKQKDLPYTIQSVGQENKNIDISALQDKNLNTYSDFPITTKIESEVVLRFIYESPITTDTLQMQFSPNGGFPTTIALKAVTEGAEDVVIAEKSFGPITILFPRRTASVWELTLNYNQPLRITEANFIEENSDQNKQQSIRFLTRPGFSYRLFSNPEGYVNMPYVESGNLVSVTDVLTFSMPVEQLNPLYKQADDDIDGVIDSTDNCPKTANPDQLDKNENGLGDACEDFDKDGLMNSVDNCPSHPNREQQDTDGDKVGDHCDTEESRLTERLAFLPWLGIALGFGVVITIFAITVKKPVTPPLKDNKNNNENLN